MIATIVAVVGGLGMFLLGMTLMTEGLKAMAGDAIRGALMRFTKTPLSGVITGLIGTALLQSSSATIIATVGFVGAGLLTFSGALGIILGSALGTTLTGWLVAIIGFKLQLGTLASVLVFIGAFLRLFGSHKFKGLGYALAGFGLIFIGIVGLQQGMAGLQTYVDFSRFSADSLWGKFQLVIVGVIFTIITQSSSAGVVAALTALFTGAIGFDQAAALVVGMNIGTSFTAAAATIGGNVHVRRTGFSHVVYNTFVSSVALFLIAPYITLWQWLAPGQFMAHAEFALVGFHTGFNLLGVLLVLPFVKEFSRLIERLFPDKPYGYRQVLDRGLLKFPELALTAVQKVLADQTDKLARQLAYILGDAPRATPLLEMTQELNDIQEYIDSIHLDAAAGVQWERLLAAIQMVDHLQRLQDRAENKAVKMALHEGTVDESARVLLQQLLAMLQDKNADEEGIKARVVELTDLEQSDRSQTLEYIASGKMDLKRGVGRMEVVRWMQHVAVHIEYIDNSRRQLNYQQPAS
ncbi:MAG TPA: Na/Pi symporter [Cellvibrionaceae bacterium]